ncbi:hypothetical protein D3C74_449380 [compost metagenome]
MIDLRKQKQTSSLTHPCGSVHTVRNAQFRRQPVCNIRLQHAAILQKAANLGVGKQYKFVDRIKADASVFLRAILFVRLKRQKFNVVRLLHLFLGHRVLRQLETAIDLIFQTQ